MPDKPEKVQLAKAYVALSNSHHLELIFNMFTKEAVYQSPNVGEFSGIDEIRGMMNDFFKSFPNVYWDAHGFHFGGLGRCPAILGSMWTWFGWPWMPE